MRLISLLSLFIVFINCECKGQWEFDKTLDYHNYIEIILKEGNDSLKVELIEYLLSKKGDKEINKVWYGYTNESDNEAFSAMKSTSSDYNCYTTNQFAALYLISALYYSDLEFCKSIKVTYFDDGEKKYTTNLMPVLKKRRSSSKIKYKCVDNTVIDEMYDYYEKWFNKMKLNGWSNIEDPLHNSPYRWVQVGLEDDLSN